MKGVRICWTVDFLCLFVFPLTQVDSMKAYFVSELQDVNLLFHYRSPNHEIKRSQIWFLLFYSVTQTSLHSNQRPCMLYFYLIPLFSYHRGTIHIQPPPTEKQFQSRFQLNFCIGDPIFFYCKFYKEMTILGSMLPRMNIFNT